MLKLSAMFQAAFCAQSLGSNRTAPPPWGFHAPFRNPVSPWFFNFWLVFLARVVMSNPSPVKKTGENIKEKNKYNKEKDRFSVTSAIASDSTKKKNRPGAWCAALWDDWRFEPGQTLGDRQEERRLGIWCEAEATWIDEHNGQSDKVVKWWR